MGKTLRVPFRRTITRIAGLDTRVDSETFAPLPKHTRIRLCWKEI